MSFDLYGIGNALVDIEVEVTDDDLTRLGIEKGIMSLVDAERQLELITHFSDKVHQRACGGSAGNTMIAAQQLGAKGFYSCLVSNDDTGQFFMDDLARQGVRSNLSLDSLPTGHTGTCLVMVTPDTERTMNTFLGISSELSEAQVDYDALRASHALYIEGYLVTSPSAMDAIKKASRFASDNDIKTVLTFSDPSMVMYFKDGLKEIVAEGVDLLFCNEEEARLYTGAEDSEDVMHELKSVAKRYVVTRGKDGAVYFDGNTSGIIQPFLVDAVDSNGAGDSFAGAFLAGLCRGKSFAEAGQLASFMSSRVVSHFGPRILPERLDEVLEFSSRI